MSSTYTTSLTLTQIGNGEQSGTWGTTTNTNWQLIEDSVAGVAQVTVSGSTGATLSVANGTTDQSRNAVIVVTGSISTSVAIVAPLVKKVYIISNQTTGGFAITIGAATGSTVSITNGLTTLVYCDGTNFFSGITGFTGGNLNITGTINATGTITGANFATSGGVPQLTGGATGQIPYQTGPNNTGYTPAPTTGSYLTWTGSAYSWSTGSVTTATNLAGGGSWSVPYQTSAGNTLFLTPSGGTTLTLQWNGSSVSWAPGGAVSSFSAGTTGLTPNTPTGSAVVLGGTLNVANGGTGATSFASAGLLTTTTGAQLSGATFTGAIGSNSNILTSGQVGLSGTGLNYSRMVGSSVQLYDSNSSVYANQYGAVGIIANGYAPFSSNGGGAAPGADNTYSLGFSSLKWTAVWAVNGAIQTSDARLKTDVTPSPLGLNFISKLNPVSYRWISGGNVEDGTTTPTQIGGDTVDIKNFKDKPGVRTHYGLLAQEVKNVLDQENVGDFAGWVLEDINDPNSPQGLNYAQFIAPLIKAVQELSAEVTALKAKVGA
jgi:hypothetical protein